MRRSSGGQEMQREEMFDAWLNWKLYKKKNWRTYKRVVHLVIDVFLALKKHCALHIVRYTVYTRMSNALNYIVQELLCQCEQLEPEPSRRCCTATGHQRETADGPIRVKDFTRSSHNNIMMKITLTSVGDYEKSKQGPYLVFLTVHDIIRNFYWCVWENTDIYLC